MQLSKKQNEYIVNATHRWNIKSGAVRSGKSYVDTAFVVPFRIRERTGKPGLNVILGVSKESIERNVLQPMREIYTNKLIGQINNRNMAHICGEEVYCLGAEKVSQVAKIQGSSIKYCYGDEALMTPHGGFRHPANPTSFEYEDFGNGIVRAPIHTLINGMNVFSFAISRPPKSIESFLADYNIDRNVDIDYFLIHQANKMIVDRIVKKLKFPQAKVPYNLEEFGNLGGASIPSLMVTRIREQLIKQEVTLLMSSFGLGLSWGTMWMKTKQMVVPQLVILK